LRAARGNGMTEEEVNHFVDGCSYLNRRHATGFGADHSFSNPDYPSYELFTETLREGVFKPHNSPADTSDWQGRQLRLVVNRDRRVQEVIQI
jgi:D-glycerate 3-kinase